MYLWQNTHEVSISEHPCKPSATGTLHGIFHCLLLSYSLGDFFYVVVPQWLLGEGTGYNARALIRLWWSVSGNCFAFFCTAPFTFLFELLNLFCQLLHSIFPCTLRVEFGMGITISKTAWIYKAFFFFLLSKILHFAKKTLWEILCILQNPAVLTEDNMY